MADSSRLACVVDDDPSERRALYRLMHTHGYDARAFASGRGCLNGHEVNQAEVVIIDVSMTAMDGFECDTLLRASGRNIPTIFISADANRQYPSRTKSVGAITFLNRPCNEADLLRAIESAIEA